MPGLASWNHNGGMNISLCLLSFVHPIVSIMAIMQKHPEWWTERGLQQKRRFPL